MEMDGKNIKKLIDEQTDKLEVPASLQPEAVVERLEEKAKKKRRSYYKKAAAFAACGVVVLGIGAVGMWNRLSPDDGETLYKTADKGEKTESGEVTAGRIDTAEDFEFAKAVEGCTGKGCCGLRSGKERRERYCLKCTDHGGRQYGRCGIFGYEYPAGWRRRR